MTIFEIDGALNEVSSRDQGRRVRTQELNAVQREELTRLLQPGLLSSPDQRVAPVVDAGDMYEGALSETSLRYVPIVVPMLAVVLCACIAVIWTLV